ncbi:hypothetical protein JTB14_015149 [Gonioctena quinquepunctata]|nr:hypothetical protein JTB14_015149 [Gonioctena quinquepunctata]
MVNPTVKICDGELRGCERIDLDGKSFLAFLGIPYAKPPVGELRFKAPQPAESWKGVRDATKDGECCIQSNMGMTEGSEDCLNLNVFTKELRKENYPLKPVMVWIHGGAFMYGSNQITAACPDFLMTEDIVLVAINYRLGFLGFLSLEDPSLGVPGNAALKDQTLALKWVQNNIKSFGGDPNNVTIFGESAGAASVHYHLLSQSSKGLFHKAIMQSGCSLNPWTLKKQRSLEFVRFMGREVDTEKEALEILKNSTAEELVEYQSKYVGGKFEIISPVIEKPNETQFITQHPIELIATGNYNKVPLLLGYCSAEGLLFDESGDSYAKLEKGSQKSKAVCENCQIFITGRKCRQKTSICDRLPLLYWNRRMCSGMPKTHKTLFILPILIRCRTELRQEIVQKRMIKVLVMVMTWDMCSNILAMDGNGRDRKIAVRRCVKCGQISRNPGIRRQTRMIC